MSDIMNRRLRAVGRDMDILRARIRQLEAENARLREALSALYDHQNGPPLPKYEQGWRDAMDLARALQEETK